MSNIAAYLKLVPKGIKNFPKIVEGIVNNTRMELGMLPSDEVDIIIERRIICATCPHMSKNAPDYISDIEEEHCIWCKCIITYKTASLNNKCGLEDYNKKYKKNEKLKW